MSGTLTRINNNQISDAVSGNVYFGINANTKVIPGSITSALLANNLTYGSDLTITGNLTVVGTSTGPITVGPRIAALFLIGLVETNELSFSLASTPGDINVSAMLMSYFLFCYKYVKNS
jgi:hypothetical protein